MVKLCLLEVSPTGPIALHSELFSHPEVDSFYVTHDEKVLDEKCLGFYYHDTWASNRNALARLIAQRPTKYTHYMFVDYDVDLKSTTALSVIDQLLLDLENTHAAVLVPTPEAQSSPADQSYMSSLFSNNQVKIIHRSLIDYFFPLPDQFGGFWDCASFWNILEIPLRPYVIRTPFVTAKSTVSAAYEHNTDHVVGTEAMEQSYRWLKFHGPMPSTVAEVKAMYLEEQEPAPLGRHSLKFNFASLRAIDNFFDTTHPHFTRMPT
jgi:hypothetical protein